MRNFYKMKLNEVDSIKRFSSRILGIDSEALMRTEDRQYCVDAKSIMGIFSLDLTKNLILEINGNEEKFVKDIGDMGIYIEPISIGV